MTWAARINVCRCFAISVIFVLLVAVFFPMAMTPLVHDQNTQKPLPGIAAGARGARVSLVVEDEDTTWINSSGETYSSVLIRDNATLIINKGIIVDVNGPLKALNNSNVIIYGKVEAYSVFTYCNSFIIDAGVLECRNENSPTKDGYLASVIIWTENNIELLNGGKIDSKGQDGGSTQTENEIGGSGGHSTVELKSNSKIFIKDNSYVKSVGGNGGTGTYYPYKGGDPGNGEIYLQANGTGESIIISVSAIEARGGKGGNAGDSSEGQSKNGGIGKITIESKNKVRIKKSVVATYGGSPGSGGSIPSEKGGVEIDFICTNLYVDKYKKDDENLWLDTGSTEIITEGQAPFITINAPSGAHLYTPEKLNKKAIDPQSASTVVYIHQVLSVGVRDRSEEAFEDCQPIVDADVDAKLGSQPEGTGKTNSEGNIQFLLIAYQIKPNKQPEPLIYTVTANKLGVGETIDNVTLPDRINFYQIQLTLVNVKIAGISFRSKTYNEEELKDGLVVAGIATFIGTALSGTGEIDSVSWELDSGGSRAAIDTSALGDWSTWTFPLDTKNLTGNIYVEVTAIDGPFSSTDGISLTINQDILPDAPDIEIVTPTDNENVTDDYSNQDLTISGTAFDPDRNSVVLTHSKEIVRVRIIVQDSNGNTVYESEWLTLENGKLKFDSKNNSYTWSDSWKTYLTDDTGEWKYPDEPEPNNKYKIIVIARDNTTPNPLEGSSSVMVSLRHIGLKPSEPPIGVIKSIKSKKNAEKAGFEFDDIYKNVVYKFKSTKGANDVVLNIDLSPSYDEDGSEEDLRFMVEEYGPSDWQASSVVQLEFFSAEAKKKEFTVEVKVRDKWGWENDILEIVTDENADTRETINKRTITIVIEFVPKDPPDKGILADLTGVGVNFSNDIIHIIFIILIIVINIIAGVMISSKFKKINKRRKAREAALDTARIKAMEAEDKKKDDIYSHIQYVDEEPTAGTGEIAVAGAAAADLSQQDLGATSIEELAKPAEPEAPQLVSAGTPVFESDVKAPEFDVAAAQEQETVEAPTTPTPTAPSPAAAPAATATQAQPAQPAVAQPAQPAQPTATPTQPAQAKPTEEEQQ